MYIQVILNLNQEEKVLGNKFIDNLKNLNGVGLQSSKYFGILLRGLQSE